MAKILEHCCEGRWLTAGGKPYVVMVRFLGTTPQTSNLYQLLNSVCAQLSKMVGRTWEAPDKFKDIVNNLFELLGRAGTKERIVVLLDSIDQLMPAYNAYKMTWLPDVLPSNVKFIVSTIPEGYPILDSMREKYVQNGGKFLEITQLGQTLGMKVISKWLELKKRTMTDQQKEIVLKALEQCSLPLYARIAYDYIRKWRSYDTPSLDLLQVTVKGAINQLFDSMETKFGRPLVQVKLVSIGSPTIL